MVPRTLKTMLQAGTDLEILGLTENKFSLLAKALLAGFPARSGSLGAQEIIPFCPHKNWGNRRLLGLPCHNAPRAQYKPQV